MSGSTSPSPTAAAFASETHPAPSPSGLKTEKTPERPSVTVLPQSGSNLRSQSQYDRFRDAPPDLNYTIKTPRRERRIVFWFSLLLLEAGVLPLILFFAIRWGTKLSITTNLAIITSLIGAVSGYRMSMRTTRLWFAKDHHTRRPVGAGRWGLDSFHIMVALAMGGFFIPLIIGSSVKPADPRVVALALPDVMLIFCLPLLITGLFPHKIRVPVRVSSLPPLKPLPPLVYTIVEDVVAVDGNGGTEFRQAWRVRYEESLIMRQLVRHMSLVWGTSGVIVGSLLIAGCWTLSVDTAYGICYGVPWLWGIVFFWYTLVVSHRMLAREEREWTTSPRIHRARTLPIVEGKYDPPAIALDEHGNVRRSTSEHAAPRKSTQGDRRRSQSRARAGGRRSMSGPGQGSAPTSPMREMAAAPISVQTPPAVPEAAHISDRSAV